MTNGVNATNAARAVLKQAEDLIAPALKTGACSDPRLLEALAGQLPSLGVDNEKQLKLMLDAAFFFYVSGRPDRGLEIAAKATPYCAYWAITRTTKLVWKFAAVAMAPMSVTARSTPRCPRAFRRTTLRWKKDWN